MFRFSASSDANSVIKTIQKRNISNADNFIFGTILKFERPMVTCDSNDTDIVVRILYI